MQYRHRSRGSFCQYGSSFLWSTMLKTQPIGHTMILPCPRDHCTRRQQKRRFATQIGRNVLGKIAPQISRIAPHLTPKAACEARRLMWDGNGQEGAVCDHILVRKFFLPNKNIFEKKPKSIPKSKKNKNPFHGIVCGVLFANKDFFRWTLKGQYFVQKFGTMSHDFENVVLMFERNFQRGTKDKKSLLAKRTPTTMPILHFKTSGFLNECPGWIP